MVYHIWAMEKIISFGIPCYNSEAYMRKCIDNLVAAGDDVEVIIVNDGSKDKTLEIAREYEKKYPTIVRVIDQENKGHGGAVMAALRLAKGEYYKVIDSDDWALTEDVVEYCELIKKHRNENIIIDLYISNYKYEHVSDGQSFSMHYRKYVPSEKVIGWNDFKRFGTETYLLMHSLLYRREALLSSGLDLPEHTYYVDNLYAYVPYPFMNTIYYHDIDFYHYLTGRFDQSVSPNVMFGKYKQQLVVARRMVEAYSLAEIKKMPKMLAKYMWHDFQIIMIVSYLFTVGGKDNQKERKKDWYDFLKFVKQRDIKMYRKMRYRSKMILSTMLHPWKSASWISVKLYYYYRNKKQLG